VIGVILMVAITVILAAVIGAFVLEIGDQQETAPSTSFDTSQEIVFRDTGPGGRGDRNLTTVNIAHAGGDTLDVSQNQILVEGTNSTWEFIEDGKVKAFPVPNVWETRGSNDPVEFASGETWTVQAYRDENGPNTPMKYAHQVEHTDGNNGVVAYFISCGSGCGSTAGMGGADGDSIHITPWRNSDNALHDVKPLQTGDDTRVVWTASSGGKTQTLFKYTVQ
jgi:hypothetical protein